jgi:predicted PurR-regulated permease PerM
MATRSESTGPADTPAQQPALARFAIDWSDQSVRLVVLGLAVLGILWLARSIIGPFVVAGVFAYAFSPVVSAVQSRTRLPRVAVVGLGYVLVLGLVALLAYVAAERAGRELSELSSGGHDIIATALHKLLGNSVVIAGNTYNVDDLAVQLKQTFLGLFSSPSGAVQMAERAVEVGLQVILCLIITFYLLLDGNRFGQFGLRFLARGQRASTLSLVHEIHVVLGRWLRGQMLLIALVSVVFYVFLGPILHVPYALTLGILSGVLEIIPLVGPVIAAALAGTVTFATHGTDTTLVVLVVYFVVRQVEDQVVMPLVIGRAVHLHPVITIFAVLVGLSTWGVLGGLLGVPVAAAINVTLHVLYPEETGSAVAESPRKAEKGSGPMAAPAVVRSAGAGTPQATRAVARKQVVPGSVAPGGASAVASSVAPAGSVAPAAPAVAPIDAPADATVTAVDPPPAGARPRSGRSKPDSNRP